MERENKVKDKHVQESNIQDTDKELSLMFPDAKKASEAEKTLESSFAENVISATPMFAGNEFYGIKYVSN
jgi:hypothetical protein